MQMDSRAIMGARPVNALAALSGGAQAASMTNEVQNQNALRGFIRENGAGVMQGDQNALAGLAGFDPQAALGVQTTRLGMDATKQSMRFAETQEGQRAAAAIAQMDAAQAADRASRIEAALKQGVQLYQSGDVQGLNMLLSGVGEGTIASLDEFPAIAAKYADVFTMLKNVRDFNAGDAGDVPATFDALHRQALAAGFAEGTPEYQGFMANGGGDPAAYRALQMQAQAAGFVEGTPQYQEFMATRGAGLQAGARVTAENQADIETGGQAARAIEEGKDIAQMTQENLKAYSAVRANISKIDEAIDAIDRGADANALYNRLPRLSEASATLQNAMDRMGLDVIGSVTFGALSAAELALAMETAVPRNLPTEELRDWFVRRRDAQQKASIGLLEAAEFFANGGTVAQYVERIKNANQSPVSGANARGGGAQDLPSDDDLLNLYGAGK